MIAHSEPQNALFVYSLTASGISFSAPYPSAVPNSTGILKASPDGTMIAQTGQTYGAAVYNFDRATGALTPRFNSLSMGGAGCSFSPDSKLLYTAGHASVGAGIFQYDMTVPDPNATMQAQIPADFSYIISSCSTVDFSAPSCATYAWNFGDGMTSKAQNPTHTYALKGAYTVTLTLNGSAAVSHIVQVGLTDPSLAIFGPAHVCLMCGNPLFYNYSANSQSGLIYKWTVGGGTISGASDNNNIDVVWNTLPATVQLTVTDPATGCSASKRIKVTSNCNTAQSRVYDFVGDNRTEFTTLENITVGAQLKWKVLTNPPGPPYGFIWGTIGDTLTPSDFLSTDKNDVSVWRAGTYYISQSFPPSAPIALQWGVSSDIAGRDGDYDGDGKANPTIVRVVGNQLNWFMQGLPPVQFGSLSPGMSTYIFEGADFTADGRDELVLCQVDNSTGTTTWLIGDSLMAILIMPPTPWGNFDTDFLVEPDDYTGDCKADLVVWRGRVGIGARPWHIRDTATTNQMPVVTFGLETDLPLRGDYDGDGKADIAVFRPGPRIWYWLRSSDNTLGAQR